MQVFSIPMESLAQIMELQIDSGGVARLVVTGESMHPTLRHRKDVVILVPVPKKLERGDLILYKRENGQYVLHRIISKPKDGRFYCCGDNQWEKEPVCESQAIAFVSGIIRQGKQIESTAGRYRLWVGFWLFLFPVRRPLLSVRRFFGRIRRKLR